MDPYSHRFLNTTCAQEKVVPSPDHVIHVFQTEPTLRHDAADARLYLTARCDFRHIFFYPSSLHSFIDDART